MNHFLDLFIVHQIIIRKFVSAAKYQHILVPIVGTV